MKKILLLGGSAQQIVAIKTAKRMGYYTVLCDYLNDNPGQYVADKFYLVSTIDKEAVLSVAQTEKINGIVAYASDPAAPTAAFVSERMGLPTNPYQSVQILSEKHLFRKYLKNKGFNCPKAASFTASDLTSFEIVIETIKDFQFPVMVKPIDSSGSKGVSCINNIEEIEIAANFALKMSRCKTIILEEYIQKSHQYMIGGDIFIQNGKVAFWGLLNCHRDTNVNPLVPVGKSYPLLIDEDKVKIIHKETQCLLESLNIKSGAFNVEMMFKAGKLYFIEMGPRNGGNMIPDLLQMISGVDLVAATIESAMGNDAFDLSHNQKNVFYSTCNVHSDKNGTFLSVEFRDELKPRIVRKNIYKSRGDVVEYFDGANKALGIVFLKHDSKEQMLDMMDNADKWIKVVVE